MADIVPDEENEFAVPKFTIDIEITRQYRRFNAVGTELTVRLLPPARGDDSDAVTHFQTCVTDFFVYALRNCRDFDMVGLTIRNEVNIQDKAIGISFRRNDQLSEEVIWSVFNKVAQSNARFNPSAWGHLIPSSYCDVGRFPAGFLTFELNCAGIYSN